MLYSILLTREKVQLSIIGIGGFLIALAMITYQPVPTGQCFEVHLPMGGWIKKGECPQTPSETNKNVSLLIKEPQFEIVRIEYSSATTADRPSDITTPGNTATYLAGAWNLAGTSSGYPIIAKAVFNKDGTYQLSGNISSIDNGEKIPFYYSGTYSIDNQGKTLSTTTSEGIRDSYNLEKHAPNYFSMSNLGTSEYYNLGRGNIQVAFPERPIRAEARAESNLSLILLIVGIVFIGIGIYSWVRTKAKAPASVGV